VKRRPLLMRVVRGRRGRRGRRGPPGQMPQHEWSEDGTRIRFEIEPGKWGAWTPLLHRVPDNTI